MSAATQYYGAFSASESTPWSYEWKLIREAHLELDPEPPYVIIPPKQYIPTHAPNGRQYQRQHKGALFPVGRAT